MLNISFIETRFAENGVVGNGGDIWSEDTQNVTFIADIFVLMSVPQANIAEYGTCSGIRIIGCQFANLGHEIDPIIEGANTFLSNDGFVTENSGIAYINATTTVTFDHGMSITPSTVLLSFNSTGFTEYIWSATSSQITVTVTTSGTYKVMWYSEY